ncbi:GGDEF domain-containing protein [Alicyclobacillus ferrooxydans]|uniref:GGDEF domain-containing protein n=1 Tax=Alicyclobacillus ferrooxydans TaxID=471514 RepID=UPI0006D584EE|nr:GGDEF domain-containing protein [Alicyclobacillus ferrooxydans]
MSSNLLREFLYCSRDWSSMKRGIDLFQSAANILLEVAQIDSGFFVYKKRLPSNEASRLSVYHPWGEFDGRETQLQLLADVVVDQLQDFPQLGQRWFPETQAPSFAKILFGNSGFGEYGLWPLVSKGQVTGALVVARTHPMLESLSNDMRTALLDVCATQISLVLDLILACRIVEQISQQDVLTGLLNRRGIESRVLKFVEKIQSAGKHVVFGLIDIDELKAVNDTHGHPVGDQALREVAEAIRSNVRSNDLVARFGGDEFCVVIEADKSDGVQVMERIRQSVQFQSGHSVSVGGAIWGLDGDSLEQCYEVADMRLYDCKRYTKSISP